MCVPAIRAPIRGMKEHGPSVCNTATPTNCCCGTTTHETFSLVATVFWIKLCRIVRDVGI